MEVTESRSGGYVGFQALIALLLVTSAPLVALAQGIPGPNVNIVGPTPELPVFLYPDKALKQQNEVYCAVNPANELISFCGYNDYRGVEDFGDTWIGASMSRDGGLTWQSRLAPGWVGYPTSLAQEFAADPIVSAVPGLVSYLFIASVRGGKGDGGIYLQHWFERNKEDGFPYEPSQNTLLVAKGTACPTCSGRFIDKPHAISELAPPGSGRPSVTVTGVAEDGSAQSATVPPGELHVVYSVFTGNKNNPGSKILHTRSLDWGQTWEPESKLTESVEINQSVYLATKGDQVLAVWRRFSDNNEVNAVMSALSQDRGKTWSSPQVLQTLACPFDQGTSKASFRTTSYPVATSDGKDFYVFWTQRGLASGNPDCLAGLARVTMTKSADGVSWSPPLAVSDESLAGHQFMPAASAANGKVKLAFYDTRDDLYPAFTQFVDDAPGENGVRHHTADIFGLEINQGAISRAVKVSNYRTTRLKFPDGKVRRFQMDYNFINARMFKTGTVPFMGDYISVAARPFRLNAQQQWVSNAVADPALEDEVFYVAWTDNRDSRGDRWANLDDGGTVYTPPIGTFDSVPGEESPELGECIAAPAGAAESRQDRARDQNVYASAVKPGSVLSLPSASKPLGALQRSWVVYLQNTQRTDRAFTLCIANQPADYSAGTGFASFRQTPAPLPPNTFDPDNLPAPTTTLRAIVPSRSTAARSVFVTSALARPPVRVLAYEGLDTLCASPGQAPVASVLINGNAFVSALEQPDSADCLTDASLCIDSFEVHNPDIVNVSQFLVLNPDIQNPDIVNPDIQNVIVLNPDIVNPDIQNPDIQNPDIVNPDIQNPDIVNPDIENPDIVNPDIQNPDIQNPDIQNPDIQNPDIQNPDIQNGALDEGYVEVSWTVENTGNTTTGYNAVPFVVGQLVDEDGNPISTQLVVSKNYLVPTSRNCQPALEGQNQVLLNVVNPSLSTDGTNPDVVESDIDAATFFAAPGEKVNVTLRIFDPTFSPRRLGFGVYSQSCNSAEQDCSPQDLDPYALIDVDRSAPVFGELQIGQTTYEAEGPQGATVSWTLTATDLPGGEPAAVLCTDGLNQYQPSGGQFIEVFALGETTIGCSASDPVGNTASSDPFIVSVVDSRPPTFDQIINSITRSAIGPTTPVSFELTASDLVDLSVEVVCSVGAQAFSPAAGFDFGLGDSQVTCVAEDDSQNSATTRFLVSVLDTAPPTVSVSPGNQLLEASSPSGAAASFTVTASDNVAGPLQAACQDELGATVQSGSIFPLGSTNVRCEASDGTNIGAAFFTITVADTTSPSFDVAMGDITREATGATTRVSIPLSASDIADTSVSAQCEVSGVSFEPASGYDFPVGSTPVLCSISDDSGNSAQANFNVIITDSTPPAVTVPADIVVEATSPSGAQVNFDVSALDLAAGPLPVQCASAAGTVFSSGSTFPLGSTVLDCRAEDSSGNGATASFVVSIVDTTAPTYPGSLGEDASGAAILPDVVADAVAALTPVSFSPLANDLVDTDLSLVCNPASGTGFGLGSTPVQCIAVDDSGNARSALFKVIVTDGSAPVFTQPLLNLQAGTEGTTAVVTFDLGAVDQVDGVLPVVCNPASGGTFPAGTTQVSCSATDFSGNTVTGSFSVTVLDTGAPVVSVPANLVLEATSAAGARADFTVTVTDNLAQDLSATCVDQNAITRNSGETYPLGSTMLSCSANDGNGNTGTAVFSILVQDTTAPALSLPQTAVTGELVDAAGSPVTFPVSLSASDLVDGSLPVSCVPASGSNFLPGLTTVTCSATDKAGNTGQGTFQVQVQYAVFIGLGTPNGLIAPNEAPKRSYNTGSSIPVEWQYGNAAQVAIDSINAAPKIRVRGPHACNLLDAGPIVVEDSGSSDLRYVGSSLTWKFNWQTAVAGVVPGCYSMRILSQQTGQENGPFVFKLK